MLFNSCVCVVFALGNAIYIAIEIQFHMRYSVHSCSGMNGWTFVFRIVFLVTQTYFLFKNPTVGLINLSLYLH